MQSEERIKEHLINLKKNYDACSSEHIKESLSRRIQDIVWILEIDLPTIQIENIKTMDDLREVLGKQKGSIVKSD